MNQINLDVLIEISKNIYRIVHPFLGSRESGRTLGVGFGGDLTRFIDQIAEETVVEYLEQKDFSCILVGEEGGVQKIGETPEEYLVVDAVDGTTNAVRGINFASASLAAASKDRLEDVEAAAVINLFDGELYVAEKDEGARH
ncbi:TPA: fructose 1,6-bisphosphatase, partial [Candidatus Bathyarchaeota archaeon]|nr:fructose 1,6-bisphosphatase [Candidatus Bathyarchaeota archaeon]